MTMIRSNFADSLAVGFEEIFFDNFKAVPEMWPGMFNRKTSKKQYEDISYLANFGTIPTKTEGAAVTFDDPIQGFDKRYLHITYALAYRITQEMQEDELYGNIKKFPASIGRSMAETRNISGAGIYNDGFDSSVRTGGDGKELFATDHPLMGGGDQKNEPTNPANLSDDALEQALIDMQATTDDRGKLLIIMPQKLITGTTLEWTVDKLLKSTLDPNSANNAINPAASTGLQKVINPYLTNTKFWCLMGSDHTVTWYDRIMPSNEGGDDFDTGDMKFKARARWSNGWDLPWGVYASPGA